MTNVAGAAVLTTLLLASPVSANMPTTILWPILAHVVVGNLLIGLLEGLVVSFSLRVPPGRAITFMVGANYLSAAIGLFGGPLLLSTLGDLALGSKPLHNVLQATVLLTVCFGLLTTLVEWPFGRWLVRDRKRPWRTSLPGVAAAQVVSYALLVPYYVEASQLGLYEKLKVEHSAAFASTPEAWVYFLAPNRNRVLRIRLNGTGMEAVAAKSDWGYDPWLATRPGTVAGTTDLLLAGSNPHSRGPKDRWPRTILARGIPGSGGSPERSAPFGGINYYWLDEMSVVDFRAPDQRRRRVCADLFAWYGLMLKEELKEFKTTARGEYLAFETPFFRWPARCPTMLPGDQVVFQLGDQVVLADLPSRRIAFLARGRGPAVVLESIPGPKGH